MGDVHGKIPGGRVGGKNVHQQEGSKAIDFLGPIMLGADKREVEAGAMSGTRTRGVEARVEKGASFFPVFKGASPRCSSVKAQAFSKTGS